VVNGSPMKIYTNIYQITLPKIWLLIKIINYLTRVKKIKTKMKKRKISNMLSLLPVILLCKMLLFRWDFNCLTLMEWDLLGLKGLNFCARAVGHWTWMLRDCFVNLVEEHFLPKFLFIWKIMERWHTLITLRGKLI